MLSKHIFEFILIYCSFINITLAVSCILNEDSWCEFKSIRTTSENLFFQPSALYPSQVTKVKFTNSTIHTLTNEICNKFPNLEELEIDGASLEKISDGALDNCSQLTDLSLWTNKLTEIPKDIFRNTRLLETLTFQHNELQEIDPIIFANLTRLKTIALNENYLKEFPVYKMPRISSIVTIWIHHNDITDLDEQEIMFKFPNLKTIYMEDNPFDCDRVKVIIAAFKRKSITIDRWHKTPRERKYKLTVVDTVDCLSKEEGEKILIKTELDNLIENNEIAISYQNLTVLSNVINKLRENITEQQKLQQNMDDYYQKLLRTTQQLKLDINVLQNSKYSSPYSFLSIVLLILFVVVGALAFWLYKRNNGLAGFKFAKTQDEVEFTSCSNQIYIK